MRQIVLDTETTGLETSADHRIIEIGCVEMIDRKVTDNYWHFYINPDREIDAGAFSVHGISTEFLQDKPHFEDIAEDFLSFVRGAELVIHNAPFDMGFLNHEFAKLDTPLKLEDHCSVLDSLVMARQKHPGQKNNLDALCKRYDIDNSSRTLHGALLDSQILAEVYLMMTGGQKALLLDEETTDEGPKIATITARPDNLELPIWQVDEKNLQAHDEYLELLSKKSETVHW